MVYEIIQPKCVWYQQSLYESTLDDERHKLWSKHVDCGGLNIKCEHYLESELESIVEGLNDENNKKKTD